MSRYGDYDDRDYRPRRQDSDDLDIDIRRSSSARRPRPAVAEYPDDRPPRRVPDFLRDDYDYGREAQPLVIRRRDDDYDMPGPSDRLSERDYIDLRERDRRDSHRAPPRRREDLDETEISIRKTEQMDRAPPPRPRGRSIDHEEVSFRRVETGRPRDDVHRDDTEVRIRREESRGPPPRRRPDDVDREELDIRIRREESRGPPPRPRPEHREWDEVELRREGRDIRPAMRHVSYGRRSRSRSRSSSATSRTSVTTDRGIGRSRGRRRSVPPPGRLVAREHEEFLYRRRKSSVPPARDPDPARDSTEEIIIRRREASSSPELVSEPEPVEVRPPEPEPEYLPPLHRDVITHVYTIDHGTRSASPPPPPPPEPVKDEMLEIDIRRRDANGSRESIRISDREHEGLPIGRRPRSVSLSPSPPHRSFSFSPGRRRRSRSRLRSSDLQLEAEYYNRRAMERGRPGEAYDGATRDWELVDVPPGTNRVQMDGSGGSRQEITWQRYNGDRRAKFISDGEEFATDFGIPPRHESFPAPPPPAPLPAPLPPKAKETREELSVEIRRRDGGPPMDRGVDHIAIREREFGERRAPPPPPMPSRRSKEMWTEVTKDLVIREAIIESGYTFDETEDFFYIMKYLRYEDVLQLVQLSDRIRAERRRMRDLEWDRELMPPPPWIPPPPMDVHGPPPMDIHGPPPFPPFPGPPPIPPPPFLPPGVSRERIYDRERVVVEEGRGPRKRY